MLCCLLKKNPGSILCGGRKGGVRLKYINIINNDMMHQCIAPSSPIFGLSVSQHQHQYSPAPPGNHSLGVHSSGCHSALPTMPPKRSGRSPPFKRIDSQLSDPSDPTPVAEPPSHPTQQPREYIAFTMYTPGLTDFFQITPPRAARRSQLPCFPMLAALSLITPKSPPKSPTKTPSTSNPGMWARTSESMFQD